MERSGIFLRTRRTWSFVAMLLLAPAAALAQERALKPLTQAVGQAKRLTAAFAPYDVVFRRDPLQPLVDAQGELISSTGLHGGYLVQGIIWSNERPLAVIDDELVAEGQTAGPYTILHIAPDGVIVQRAADQLFIPLDRGLDAPSAHVVSPAPAAVEPPPAARDGDGPAS